VRVGAHGGTGYPGGSLEASVHIHKRNKTARLKAALKAKHRKERLRKAGRLTKRRSGGRLVKKARKG